MKRSGLSKFSIFIVVAIVAVLSCCGNGKDMIRLLEQAEQQNRDYVPFTSDSIAKVLTAYFDSHGTPNLRMRSHYILGCAYRDLGEAPRALQCLNDAAECADTTSADCDFKTLSRVYGQIAYLFGEITAPELEIQYCRKASRYALIAKDTVAAINFYELQSGGYWLLDKRDSILFVCDSAMNMYYSIGQSHMAAATRAMAADVYLQERDYAKARNCINLYDRESGFVGNNDSVAAGHEIYYDIKGRLLLGEGKTDSAKILFERLLKKPSDINCIEAAHRGLLNVYEAKNNVDSIKKYSRLFAETNDSSNIMKSSSEIVRMQSLYNYSRMQHAVIQKEKEKNRYRMALIMVVSLIVLAIYTTFRFFRYNKRKYTNHLKERNRDYYETLKRYKDTVQLLEQAVTSNNEYEKRIEEERQKYERVLSSFTTDDNIIELHKYDDSMLNTEIVERFHQLAAHGQRPAEVEWSIFIKTFESRMPDFSECINNTEYRLSDREKIVCMLIRLSFIISEIIILLDINPQKMTNVRASINKKMFGFQSAKGVERNIKGLTPRH